MASPIIAADCHCAVGDAAAPHTPSNHCISEAYGRDIQSSTDPGAVGSICTAHHTVTVFPTLNRVCSNARDESRLVTFVSVGVYVP